MKNFTWQYIHILLLLSVAEKIMQGALLPALSWPGKEILFQGGNWSVKYNIIGMEEKPLMENYRRGPCYENTGAVQILDSGIDV